MSDRERWNERHSAAIAAGRADRPPIDWLAGHRALLDGLPRGRALDVACGRGRNALFLAALGFEVDAVDVSDVAVEHTTRAAALRDLPVRAWRLDLAMEPLPPGPYEVVVDSFFLERRILPALSGVLAPGGLLFFDTFLAEGPDDPPYRLRPGELAGALTGLEVVECREGPPASGEGSRVRMVARRPVALDVPRI